MERGRSMSTKPSEVSKETKLEQVKRFLNNQRARENKKEFVIGRELDNGNFQFIDSNNQLEVKDIETFSKAQFEELYRESLEKSEIVTDKMQELGRDIDQQMKIISEARATTIDLEKKLHDDKNKDKNEGILEEIKNLNSEIDKNTKKLLSNIEALRKFNPEPFSANPQSGSGKFIKVYNDKLVEFRDKLGESPDLTGKKQDIPQQQGTIEDIVPQKSTTDNISFESSQGIETVLPQKPVPAPAPQKAKIIPGPRIETIKKLLDEIENLAGEYKKLMQEAVANAKLLDEHATKNNISPEVLSKEWKKGPILNTQIEEKIKHINERMEQLQKDPLHIDGILWKEHVSGKENIATLDFDKNGLVRMPPNPYSRNAQDLYAKLKQRDSDIKQSFKSLDESATRLKAAVDKYNQLYARLNELQTQTTINNYPELEKENSKLREEFNQEKKRFNDLKGKIEDYNLTEKEWEEHAKTISENNQRFHGFAYETELTNIIVTLPLDLKPCQNLMDNLKQKSTQRAQGTFSDTSSSKSTSNTMDDVHLLMAMKNASTTFLKQNDVKSFNEKDGNSFHVKDSNNKGTDIKFNTQSIETKNPTDLNLEAMSKVIAANVLFRLEKNPPENPKISVGDCNPPAVAGKFAKYIDQALTDLMNKHPEKTDQIKKVQDKFHGNYSELLNKAVATIGQQEPILTNPQNTQAPKSPLRQHQ